METKGMPYGNTKRDKANSSEFCDFFIDQLKDLYWAEKHILLTLPKLQHAATDQKLAAIFKEDVKDTERQIEILEKVFELMGEEPQARKCDAMEGLIKEAESIIEDTQKASHTRDAGLILAAQKIKHYEIASYGTLRIFAGHMGEGKVKQLLEKILHDEKEADVELTKIAEDQINVLAAEE